MTRRKLNGAFSVRWLATGIAAAAPLTGLAQSMPDDDITSAVSTELGHSEVVSRDNIDVVTNGGIVSLSGTVETLAALRKAEDIATTVRGVREIDNRIEIAATGQEAPQALKSRVEDALAMDAATDAYEIEVEAGDGGRIRLTGTVNSYAEKSLAETVTATVTGVRAIENALDVDTSRAHRGSDEIRADVIGRLSWNAGVDAADIDVLVQTGGRVTLSGTVESLAERRLAAELAHVAGVREVNTDHLDIADR